jgi:hypothetical protein
MKTYMTDLIIRYTGGSPVNEKTQTIQIDYGKVDHQYLSTFSYLNWETNTNIFVLKVTGKIERFLKITYQSLKSENKLGGLVVLDTTEAYIRELKVETYSNQSNSDLEEKPIVE